MKTRYTAIRKTKVVMTHNVTHVREVADLDGYADRLAVILDADERCLAFALMLRDGECLERVTWHPSCLDTAEERHAAAFELALQADAT